MLADADKQADREAIALLKKVDKLRAELKALEPQLNAMLTQYGRRRGLCFYREHTLRKEVA
jgi:hypothetical protein